MPRGDELDDARQPGWFYVDNHVLDAYGAEIGVTAFAVYCLLARRANKARVSWPSYGAIAAAFGISRPSAIAAVRTLEQHGLIRIQTVRQQGKRPFNRYTILKPKNGPIGKEDLLVKEIDQSTGKGDLLVNDVSLTGKRALPVLVNQIDSNKTQLTRPKEQDPRERARAREPAPPRPPLVAVPQPWEWADDAEEWAREHKMSWAWVVAHTEVFCDHYLEIEDTAPERKSIEGWQAAWRKWLLKDLNGEHSRAVRR